MGFLQSIDNKRSRSLPRSSYNPGTLGGKVVRFVANCEYAIFIVLGRNGHGERPLLGTKKSERYVLDWGAKQSSRLVSAIGSLADFGFSASRSL